MMSIMAQDRAPGRSDPSGFWCFAPGAGQWPRVISMSENGPVVDRQLWDDMAQAFALTRAVDG